MIHSLAHPLSAHFGLHHGLTNAVFMPYVMVFNRGAIEHSMKLLAMHLELPKPSFEAVVDWTLSLRAGFEIPHSIQGIGVDDSQFDRLAAMAVLDPTAGGNPIELSEADCRRLLEDSYSGRLGL